MRDTVGNTAAAPAKRRSNRRRASVMASPHELQCLPANAEGFRAKVAKSNRFRIARLPEALPLPLILRDIGKSRWQLCNDVTPVVAPRGRGRATSAVGGSPLRRSAALVSVIEDLAAAPASRYLLSDA
jgi:hypothetical protein